MPYPSQGIYKQFIVVERDIFFDGVPSGILSIFL